jgi:sugar phosphate isomerase/epimerase
MEIFLHAGSIQNWIHRCGLTLTALPDFVRKLGFAGIEIADRQIAGFSDTLLAGFAEECVRKGLGVVLDVGCDLTLASHRHLQDQIAHARDMTRTAATLKARGVRIWLGGQMFSIQRIASGMKPKKPSAGAGPREERRVWVALKKFFVSRPVTGIAHGVRKRMPSRRFGVAKKMRRAVTALRTIVGDPASESLFFAVENHWGISGRPENLLAVVEAVGSHRLGTCPDFANFPADVDRYQGLGQLAPKAVMAHAKLPPGKNPKKRAVDFHRCLKILKENGFDGILTVEHDGPGDGLSRCRMMQHMIRESWERLLNGSFDP